MPSNFPENLLEAYGAASASLARADERMTLCANRPALLARLRMLERDALGQLEGENILPENLAAEYGYSPRAWKRWPHAFVQVFDKAIAGRAQPGAGAIRRWLSEPRSSTSLPATRVPVEIHADRLKAWEQRCASARRQATLLAAADLAAEFALAAPLTRGNFVIATMLADRCVTASSGLSAGGIAAIGIMRRQIPWARLLNGRADEDADDLSPAGQRAQLRLAWLEALSEGGRAVIDLAQRLTLWQQQLDDACAGKRRTSHLRGLAELAIEHPPLTASRTAKMLGISRQGATQLLEEARAHHILREVTQGNAFRRYTVAI